MRVLVFGDSIAQGFWDTEGGWVARLIKHYDSLALQDLRNNKQPEIFNLGVSGDTTRNLLERIEPETRVRKWHGDPLFTVVAIGTNDDLFENGEQRISPEEFKENIISIMRLLKPLSDGMMFVGSAACNEKLTTPVSWANIHYTNKQIKKYEQLIQEITSEQKIPFVPIFEPFKKELDTNKQLLADGLHPNNEGHELIFQLVRPELDRLLAS